jgi:phosphoglycerate dehydrogenase-like enzyme
MTTRILSTSPLVGSALVDLGHRFPALKIAAFRSPAWSETLAEAEAIVVLLSEPLTEADLTVAPRLRAIGTYSVGMDHLPVKA